MVLLIFFVPVPETFKALTPKLTLKIRCLIWVKSYIGVRFVVDNGIKIASFIVKLQIAPLYSI